VGITDGVEVGSGVGTPAVYDGDRLGTLDGATEGDEEGAGVGLPAKYVGSGDG